MTRFAETAVPILVAAFLLQGRSDVPGPAKLLPIAEELQRVRAVIGPEPECRRYNDTTAFCNYGTFPTTLRVTVSYPANGETTVTYQLGKIRELASYADIEARIMRSYGVPDGYRPRCWMGNYYAGDMFMKCSLDYLAKTEIIESITFSRADRF